jgi:hypothetical protein
MTDKVSQYDWPLFRFAIRRPSLYVLGAGASAPIISSQISDRIRKTVWENGVYEGSARPASRLKQRLLPYDIRFDVDADMSGSISQNELDSHTPDALVEALFARLITVPGSRPPPQYEVFDLVPASVVFNFNNDNLADAIHRRHLYLRPHGAVNCELVHSPFVSQAILYLAIPDSFPMDLDYHRPLPEPTDITSRTPYQMLARHFHAMHAVVIIGYSFGEQPATGSIDDSESFKMIIDLLRWRPRPVLIVGPDPERLFLRIESAIRKRAVSMLRCKWNVLAEYILVGAFENACKEVHRKGLQEITSQYLRFADLMNDERSQNIGLRAHRPAVKTSR